MGDISVRILVEGEEALVEAFLLPYLDSSMLMFGNIQARGLNYQGQRYEGIYAGAFDGAEMIGVVAYYWNQNLILQAPSQLSTLVNTVMKESGQPIGGILGPDQQVQDLKQFLELSPTDLRHDEAEKLYSLQLSDLIMPGLLQSSRVRGRLADKHDIDLLVRWRMAYLFETMDQPDNRDLAKSSRQAIKGQIAEARTWVVEHHNEVVATSSLNASVQNASGTGIVQIGGVWTPPKRRRRGYGRSAVAASLVDVRDGPFQKAVLFTGENNVAAQKAYLALGFRHIGAYRLAFLHHPLVL